MDMPPRELKYWLDTAVQSAKQEKAAMAKASKG